MSPSGSFTMRMDSPGVSETKKWKKNFSWPSFSLGRLLLSSLCIQWGMLMVVGLKLQNVTVPTSGIIGGSVSLGCDYLLESDRLLSLKWYRDGHEFFRFSPGNRDEPVIKTFNSSGVHVDRGETLQVQHNRVWFRLKNLDTSSGGMYKCEISADAPTFQTLYGEGNLSIMAVPSSPNVKLSGFPSEVEVGGRVHGNCSFADTFPAAELTVYLNNVKINSSKDEIELIYYKPIKLGQLLTSIVGMKFRAAPKYFQNGVLHIKCEAKLFDRRWETLTNITNQNYQPTFYTVGQNRYSSGGGDANLPLRVAVWIMAIVAQFM